MNPTESKPKSFSGRTRVRTTQPSVRVANVVARTVISLGGIATILAVLLVCVFLISVVIPLFISPEATALNPFKLESTSKSQELKHLTLNEYGTMGWAYGSDGTLRLFRLDTGEALAEIEPTGDRVPTAHAFSIRNNIVAFGFEDGSIQYGKIDFKTFFLDESDLPQDLKTIAMGESRPFRSGMLERTPENQFRLQTLRVDLKDPVVVEPGVPVRLIDISMKSSGPVLATFTENRTLHVNEVYSRKNLMTGKVTIKLTGGRTAVDIDDGKGLPHWLMLTGLGDNVILVWNDGSLLRFNTRKISQPVLAEKYDLITEDEITLTAFAPLLGKSSLVSGDSTGRLRVWFRIKPESVGTQDGSKLVLAHELPGNDVPVTSIRSSARSRMLAAGYGNGTARLVQVTSNQLLIEVGSSGSESEPMTAITISPKEDILAAASTQRLQLWKVDVRHPESSLAAMFRPVWYEGFNQPAHVWQSSSGTDDFEPKYGLWPLIFGTLKATFYSMIFGVPLALLAAIYTSELMQSSLRGRVKTLIEMMASLPSVVLGFLAALVVAPFVENLIPEMLAIFATVPFALLLGAYLWQILPQNKQIGWARFRLFCMAGMLVFGVLLGFILGPLIEKLLYGGDIISWLGGQTGTGTGGWMFILLPSSCLLVGFLTTRVVTPRLVPFYGNRPKSKVATLELYKFLAGTLVALLLAWLVSFVLSEGVGFDPRGTFVDTYVQRNALIVGFIMGFAIIPIIYTISEDALSAVPDHLRSASLGAGATPWQTAARIIVPTAASGLFSAVMIGLGRAVGETMIVLMAAGNTPVMDWNIFNGFRTLSANIAVELPEAVKDSTHYRMLFLAALVLFLITFLFNTLAEFVRERFRKRAFQI